MNAESIANKARKSIGKFCMEECKAYCCRSSYLVMTSKEAKIVTQNRIKELEINSSLKEMSNGKYSFHMKADKPCPALKDNKCIVHKSRLRPLVCKHFPLFIEGKNIRLSSRCPAVKQGLLYPYIHKLISLCYTLKKEAPLSDLEFSEVNLKS